jgi:hypothetical protein
MQKDEVIYRQAAIDGFMEAVEPKVLFDFSTGKVERYVSDRDVIKFLESLPPVSFDVIKCHECEFFQNGELFPAPGEKACYRVKTQVWRPGPEGYCHKAVRKGTAYAETIR